MNRRGELNGRAKMTFEKVRALRSEYVANRNGQLNRSGHGNYSFYSTAAIAAREGLSQSALWSALSGRTWKGK